MDGNQAWFQNSTLAPTVYFIKWVIILHQVVEINQKPRTAPQTPRRLPSSKDLLTYLPGFMFALHSAIILWGSSSDPNATCCPEPVFPFQLIYTGSPQTLLSSILGPRRILHCQSNGPIGLLVSPITKKLALTHPWSLKIPPFLS